MSTGAKILVFIVAMFVITIVKGIAPNLVIPATMIGGFIAMKLFFSKSESSTKENTKPTIQQQDNPEPQKGDVFIQPNEFIVEKSVEEITPKVENVTPNPIVEQKKEIKLENNKEQKLITWNTWKFEKTLTQSQKVIFSLSIFSILLVICFALAESVDYKMRMKETWFIWVGFIISQAWFQNKFWNTGTKFEIAAKQPDLSGIKRVWIKYKRQFFIAFAVIAVIIIIGVSIEPISNYLEEQESKRKEQARIKHEDSITTELSKLREYKTHLKTSEDTYDLTVSLQGINSKSLSVKIKAENSELLDKEGNPMILIRPNTTMEELYAEHRRFSQTFYTDFNLVLYTQNGNISYHVNSESMAYTGDFEHPIYLNGKRIDLFSDNYRTVYHTFISDQVTDMEGQRETFLSIDSISAVYN